MVHLKNQRVDKILFQSIKIVTLRIFQKRK